MGSLLQLTCFNHLSSVGKGRVIVASLRSLSCRVTSCHPLIRGMASESHLFQTIGVVSNALRCGKPPRRPRTRPVTSRRFVLGASNVYLVGENPTCSFAAL